METAEKPLISILMAVYEPRMDWLREQLLSLNAQTYPNLRLYVRDDCSPTVPFEKIKELVRECITAFSYSIERNEKNLGSNGTFELLTCEADGEYFAYCDQDDIWLPEKLSVLQETIEQVQAGLACSDVTPIDEEGKKIAESIAQLRPRHVFQSGTGLAGGLIYRNFVIGCTMLIRRGIAQDALPFAKSMVHDHYLAFYCALEHGIIVCPQPLVCYRQHEGNQTGVLAQVKDKNSYISNHLLPFCQRVEELSERFDLPELDTAGRWAKSRYCNAMRRHGGARELFSQRKCNIKTTMFELIALRLPQPMFHAAVLAIQKGII